MCPAIFIAACNEMQSSLTQHLHLTRAIGGALPCRGRGQVRRYLIRLGAQKAKRIRPCLVSQCLPHDIFSLDRQF
jgi:hypothetical protein